MKFPKKSLRLYKGNKCTLMLNENISSLSLQILLLEIEPDIVIFDTEVGLYKLIGEKWTDAKAFDISHEINAIGKLTERE